MMDWRLYKMERASLYVKVLMGTWDHLSPRWSTSKASGTNIGGRALAYKLLRIDYYWPTLIKGSITLVKKCDKCQRHVNLQHTPTELLHSVMTPWPFYESGVDILGLFPVACKLKFRIVRLEYFTKWIEVEVVSNITLERVIHYYLQRIMCKFGLPRVIISNNKTQFVSDYVVDFCHELGVQTKFIFVIYP